jgi:hypothetical protein
MVVEEIVAARAFRGVRELSRCLLSLVDVDSMERYDSQIAEDRSPQVREKDCIRHVVTDPFDSRLPRFGPLSVPTTDSLLLPVRLLL